jgi:hypothetical protein
MVISSMEERKARKGKRMVGVGVVYYFMEGG